MAQLGPQPHDVIVAQDELVFAKHAYIPAGQETVYLGWLIVEPLRECLGLDALTPAEAAALGRMIARLSAALKGSEGAEHVYLFRLGHDNPQLHLHLVPRYPGTPREYWGMRVDEWPAAPTGGLGAVQALADRLRCWLAAHPPGAAPLG